MSGIDLEAIGFAIVAIGAGIGGAFAWLMKVRKVSAATNAAVAQSGADTAEAVAETAVYQLITARLTVLEADQLALRAELAQERRRSRLLLNHIWVLESLMRAAGMQTPVLAIDSDEQRFTV